MSCFTAIAVENLKYGSEKLDMVCEISNVNAYILIKLYEIFGLNPELSEEEIRYRNG